LFVFASRIDDFCIDVRYVNLVVIQLILRIFMKKCA